MKSFARVVASLALCLPLAVSATSLRAETAKSSGPVPQAQEQALDAAIGGLFDRKATPLDVNAVPILTHIVKEGAKLYYLGVRSGLHGWLIVKNGQVQIIYVTADGQTALFGAMFTSAGDNVTGPQVTAVAGTNKEIADLMAASSRQQAEIDRATGLPASGAQTSGGAPSRMAENMPGVSLSPGERLMQDLQAAAGVVIGKNENAEIVLIAKPTCPGCKAVWKSLRDEVKAGRIQVRLVPIGNPGDGESEAARLLQVPNPGEAWDRHVDGDKTALEGEPEALRQKAVAENRDLVAKWNIKKVPYIVYRSKEGRVKIVLGQPERMATVLSDLLK